MSSTTTDATNSNRPTAAQIQQVNLSVRDDLEKQRPANTEALWSREQKQFMYDPRRHLF